jgi:Ca2+-binding RTX toxin-like protein
MAYLEGNAGNNTIRGTANADNIEGKGGNDRLYGLGGNDDLEGDAGDDWLFGGAGNDLIEGGLGNDRLSGGGGRDIFEMDDPVTGRDLITDFQDGLDRIKVEFEGDENFSDRRIREDANGNAVVAWDGGSVKLIGVGSEQLSAADFIFG